MIPKQARALRRAGLAEDAERTARSVRRWSGSAGCRSAADAGPLGALRRGRRGRRLRAASAPAAGRGSAGRRRACSRRSTVSRPSPSAGSTRRSPGSWRARSPAIVSVARRIARDLFLAYADQRARPIRGRPRPCSPRSPLTGEQEDERGAAGDVWSATPEALTFWPRTAARPWGFEALEEELWRDSQTSRVGESSRRSFRRLLPEPRPSGCRYLWLRARAGGGAGPGGPRRLRDQVGHARAQSRAIPRRAWPSSTEG